MSLCHLIYPPAHDAIIILKSEFLRKQNIIKYHKRCYRKKLRLKIEKVSAHFILFLYAGM
jgi:hypothetical protein